MKNKKLVIIGVGGHGKVCKEIAELCGYSVSFLDERQIEGLNVVGRPDEWKSFAENSELFVAIGNNAVRQRFINEITAEGGTIATLIHPASTVSSYAKVERGCVVMAGSVVNPFAVIGEGTIINTQSSVDHDCTLSSCCHVSVGAHLAGTVSVGQRTMIGAGATVINNISICEDVTIGAGAVVVRDICEPGCYIGVTAKKIGGRND